MGPSSWFHVSTPHAAAEAAEEDLRADEADGLAYLKQLDAERGGLNHDDWEAEQEAIARYDAERPDREAARAWDEAYDAAVEDAYDRYFEALEAEVDNADVHQP
jgi:hypothetical protein